MKKIFLGILAILLVGGVAGYLFLNEKLPEGSDPEAADALAKEMLLAINDSAWQSTKAISWNFMGSHDHLWDRERHLARVKWKKYEVFVDLSKVEGIVLKDGVRMEGKEKDKLVKKAWQFWVNDSFWLNPVSKVFDEGTERSMVEFKDGRTGLRVSYQSGGDTPGDTYVWILDENNRPVAWKMWVSIIPIGGLEVPWNNWMVCETGVHLCELHDAAIDLRMENIKCGNTLEDITDGSDPFSILF